MSNTFGSLFRITSFGESHGEGIGVVIDGCPPGIELDRAFIQSELDRRKPGQSRITTQRKEDDEFKLLSGHVDLVTTGTPLGFFVPNTNARSKDYSHLKDTFRPSHADFTYQTKYGIRDVRGGGRSSARETIARVIGGAVAKLVLAKVGVKIEGWVHQIHEIELDHTPEVISFDTDTQRAVGCPDEETAQQMYHRIDETRKAGNSVGGVIHCRATGVPAGWGEPIYHKLPAALASAMLSINAVKGFDIGSGFEGTKMYGSEHNDQFYHDGARVRTHTNHSGGVQGGISNGEAVQFRVAFKPTATIMQAQQSVDAQGNPVTVDGKGRHDPCVVPRAVPIVEGMAAMVLLDMWMLHQARQLF
ncbi:chorismate synthase [Pontibacter sp. G13]|uniref:chorismate synthase n=1 Tax=Pontibacter sp. G13 TaxID=3074898 RepID=UPI00288AF0B4|nr:chorismate synthase [Pontibacter sp. G13]WNJ19877.1 chorismate synthase [Pontibacter sp. G13]